MEAFNFEQSRIEFAEIALQRVTDQENFKIVNEIFECDSSKEKMDALLKTASGWYN